jgi:hypothetical protein
MNSGYVLTIAVLDVAGRPEPLGGCGVAPVEQRIEGLKHQCA